MKFFVTYQMPYKKMDEWMEIPEADRKKQDTQMESAWNAWMASHKDAITETAGIGKPKRITSNGVEDYRNDLMMYSFVEAESIEVVADMFKDHPHFGIPDAWIEVMAVNENMGY